MDDPLVTAIVAARSVRHELERCFASIDAHAGVPVETILVDNASTDDTVEWARAEHPEVRVIELPENRFATARNEGLAQARGRYTLFLDSDAALTEGALPALVDALEAHSDWGLVAPRLVYDDGTPQPSARRFPPALLPVLRRPPLERFFERSRVVRRHLMEDVDLNRPRAVVYVIAACMLFRTELVDRIGPLDRRFSWGAEDIDWCIRVRDAGYEVVYLPEATVVHSYRRLTRRQPVSRAALRHLGAFAALQWKYRRRRRELHRLGHRLGTVTP